MLNHALHASFADSADQRASDRRLLRLEASAATPQGRGEIEVHNLSRTGMLAELAGSIDAGAAIEVELPGGTRHRADIVWSDEGLSGCRFAHPLSDAQLSAALLRSSPQLAASAPAQKTCDEAMARLRQHWDEEAEPAPASDRKLPLRTRMWIIGGLGLAGWAVPAAAAWLLV